MLEHDRAADLHLEVGGHEVEHGDGQVRIDEGVEEHHLAAVTDRHDGQDLPVLPIEELGPRRGRAGTDEELVALVVAGCERRVDDHPDEQRLLAQPLDPVGRGALDAAVGGPRPSLPFEVGGEMISQDLVEVTTVDHGGSSCPPSWRLNQ